MAIKPPNWAKGAVPTTKGWVSASGEVLASRRISKAEIAEFWAAKTPTPVSEPEPVPVLTTTKSCPCDIPGCICAETGECFCDKPDEVEERASHMTKKEIDEWGERVGVKLDRRLKKKSMVEQLKSFFTKSD